MGVVSILVPKFIHGTMIFPLLYKHLIAEKHLSVSCLQTGRLPFLTNLTKKCRIVGRLLQFYEICVVSSVSVSVALGWNARLTWKFWNEHLFTCVAAPKGLFPPEPEHYRGPKLKVAIIGAGLASMSTAVELSDQGHELSLLVAFSRAIWSLIQECHFLLIGLAELDSLCRLICTSPARL
jgi:hypothetical protein